MLTLSTKCYISTQGEEGIKNFKYKGGSDSIFYTYFWSPLCDYLVRNYFPSYLAPNLITSIGFFLHVTAHLIVLYYSPDLKQDLPPWVCFMLCFSLLAYQILDNCDGKQARITGSSSPLGMLFDHGCDAVATWIVTLNTAAIFKVEEEALLYHSVFVIGLIPFFLGMWSQYYVGAFRLGYINAVDEGLVLGELIYFLTGVFGHEMWKMKLFGSSVDLGHGFLYVCMVFSILQSIQFTNDMYQKVSFNVFLNAMGQLTCLIFLTTAFITVYQFNSEELITNNIIPIYYSLAFVWSKIITHLQVAHITQEPFDQWRYSFLFVCISYTANSLYMYAYGKYIVDMESLIYFNMVLAIICYSHFIYCVFNHIADVLNIYIFKIGKKVDTSSLPQFSSPQVQEISFIGEKKQENQYEAQSL